jgi:hypothetical protein
MTEGVTREEISQVMRDATLTGDTVAERNAERRAAVEEFLRGVPNQEWTQGTQHDMILSDLVSYPEWEREHTV